MENTKLYAGDSGISFIHERSKNKFLQNIKDAPEKSRVGLVFLKTERKDL